MFLKIGFLALFIVSITGLYMYEMMMPAMIEENTQTLSKLILAFPLMLFIIAATGFISFLLSMIRKQDSIVSEYEKTTVINRSDLPKVEKLSERTLSEDACILLSLLQEEGRLIDFLSEEITGYDDSQVASASRVIHRGCSSVLKKYFTILPIMEGEENEVIELPKDLPASHIRLHGKESDKVKVIHRGWRIASSNLPQKITTSESKDIILFPAEGEAVQS
jgi:hypothetical protein